MLNAGERDPWTFACYHILCAARKKGSIILHHRNIGHLETVLILSECAMVIKVVRVMPRPNRLSA
eukprot:6211506-Pleurochrysis_carterae.AAC.2